MILEDQVCSLELAKTLKDLGVKQKSLFWWSSFRNESSPKEQWPNVYNVILYDEEKKDYRGRAYLKDKKFYSAFTVAELLEMLPMVNGSPFQLIKGYRITEVNPTYCGRYDQLACHYSCAQDLPDENPANACAKVLIYLIQNNLIKLNGSNNESR